MQQLIDFILNHKELIAPLIIALVDFMIGINPNLKSNSIIEFILNFFGKKQ